MYLFLLDIEANNDADEGKTTCQDGVRDWDFWDSFLDFWIFFYFFGFFGFSEGFLGFMDYSRIISIH